MYFLRQFFETLLYPLRAMLSSPGKISGSARKLASISLPARISILVALFLIISVVLALIVHHTRILNPTDRSAILDRPILLLTLIIAIPTVLYYVLRLWLEGEVSRFPDIDYAWKAGLAELRAHGLDLQYVPLFFVLGSAGEAQEKALFGAVKLPLRVTNFPTGAAALHWFADPDGIYLVASDVGCLSKLAAAAKRAAEEVRVGGASTMAGPRAPVNIQGTMMLDKSENPDTPTQDTTQSVVVSQIFPSTTSSRPISNITGTMMIQDSMLSELPDPDVPPEDRKPVSLPQEVQREQEQRLEYLCRLIVKARQPLAPINGALTLLPYSIVQTGRREGSELQRAIKRDLSVMERTLKLRCPVIALVVGLEEESGFRELVRRVGREVAANQRFGKGFSVPNPPGAKQLEAIATHACGLFESKTYALFREKGSLTKPGNSKLYALLCKIRRTVRTPLTNVLLNGYAHESDPRAASDSLFFSGCYFAGSGETEDRQAFIKAVFEKLPKEQEDLEWTSAALVDEERYRRLSNVALWIDSLLLLSAVVLGIYAYMNR